MIGRALDKNNDLIIKENSIAIVQDSAETVQSVRSRLLFYLEEWFLDVTAGTPYFQEILVKPANLGTIETIIKTRILRTPGVERLVSFLMDYEGPTTRRLNIKFSAETTYGTIDNEEVTINV